MVGFAIDLGPWFEQHTAEVQNSLDRYFSGRPDDRFSGRWFDQLAMRSDPDRFEAADLVAVEALSVQVEPEAAAELLLTDPGRFNALLREIPKDVPLWEVDAKVIEHDSPADRLWYALKALPSVGGVTAGKLMAAKRPLLIPIYDSKVGELLQPPSGQFWTLMRDSLRDEGARTTIDEACSSPSVPGSVGLLRRIDVALWMYVTHGPPDV